MSAVISQEQVHRKQMAREFPIPLLSGGIAVVKVPFPMSTADFNHLKRTLDAWKPALTAGSSGGGNDDVIDDSADDE